MTDCLLPQGKFSEARKVLKAAARRNGVKLSQHLLNPEPAKDGESAAVEERWENFFLLQTFESLPTFNILEVLCYGLLPPQRPPSHPLPLPHLAGDHPRLLWTHVQVLRGG